MASEIHVQVCKGHALAHGGWTVTQTRAVRSVGGTKALWWGAPEGRADGGLQIRPWKSQICEPLQNHETTGEEERDYDGEQRGDMGHSAMSAATVLFG